MSHPKPTGDLGYPTEPHGRIPAFVGIAEEAAFWDTHDSADFLDESTPVNVSVGPELAGRLSVQLDPSDRERLMRRANAKGIGPSALARPWLEERLPEDAAGDPNTPQPH